MNYMEQQRSPLRNLPGLAVVAGLHIVLIYFLVVVLGKNTIEKLIAPIETKVIKNDEKPPPPPPPPPPPDLNTPPPPQDTVPPPDIQLTTPPPPQAAITVQRSNVAPPAPVAKAPAPTTPDVSFSAAHIVSGSRSPEYPEQYQDSGKIGRVAVDCVIETDGRPSNCKVLSSSGGSAFAQSTMAWLQGGNPPRYRPAIRGGVPQREEHQWVVTYQAPE